MPGNQLQTRVDGGGIAGQLGQAQGKAVGRMRTTLQLALVAGGFQDLEGVVFRTAQVRVGLAGQLYAEPLAGQGLTVLEPGIADGAQRHTGGLGDTPCGLFSIQAALFHPQPQVLTVTSQRDVQHLINLEVFCRRLQHRAAQGLAVGRGPSSCKSFMRAATRQRSARRCPLHDR